MDNFTESRNWKLGVTTKIVPSSEPTLLINKIQRGIKDYSALNKYILKI